MLGTNLPMDIKEHILLSLWPTQMPGQTLGKHQAPRSRDDTSPTAREFAAASPKTSLTAHATDLQHRGKPQSQIPNGQYGVTP